MSRNPLPRSSRVNSGGSNRLTQGSPLAAALSAVAITSARRFPALPDLPSLSETVPGLVMDGFFAIVAPVGTPPDAIAKLNHTIDQYLEGTEIRNRLLALGLATAGGGTPESTAQAIREQQAQWRAVGKELNVEAQ